MALRRIKKELLDDWTFLSAEQMKLLFSGYIRQVTSVFFNADLINLCISFCHFSQLDVDGMSAGPVADDLYKWVGPVYSCNVNDRGGHCLDIDKDNWSPALTLRKLMFSLRSLLADPNPDDPLVPEIAQLYKTNRKQHDANAREFTRKHAMLVESFS